MHAGAPQLQAAAVAGEMGRERSDVVFMSGIEAAMLFRHVLAQQPVGSDDVAVVGPALVDHQQQVGDLVERVEIAALRLHFRCRRGRHFLIEDLIAKRLRRGDLGGALGQPDLQLARPRQDLWQIILRLTPRSGLHKALHDPAG